MPFVCLVPDHCLVQVSSWWTPQSQDPASDDWGQMCQVRHWGSLRTGKQMWGLGIPSCPYWASSSSFQDSLYCFSAPDLVSKFFMSPLLWEEVRARLLSCGPQLGWCLWDPAERTACHKAPSLCLLLSSVSTPPYRNTLPHQCTCVSGAELTWRYQPMCKSQLKYCDLPPWAQGNLITYNVIPLVSAFWPTDCRTSG